MRNFSNLVRSLCVVLAMVFMASSAKAASSEVDIEALQCPLLGGTTIPQPAGSTITACCYDDGCYVCDANGSNCEFDPAYKGTEDGAAGEAANFTGLYLYYSSQRGDNFSTGTAKGIKAATDAGYRLVRKQGCILTKQLPGTIPLDLYWHAGRADNFTTATGAGDAQAANYKFVRTVGYIYPSRIGNTVPLQLHWSAARGDNFASATSKGNSDAAAAKYQSIRVEGYIGNPSLCD